jgi:hypothetical protein
VTVRRSILARARVFDSGIELGKPVRGGTIALDASDGDGPKWQHVATEGEYKGYLGGAMPFAFTPQIFAEITTNFRANPSYVAGPDGIGTNGIVQWDFHHASEEPPSSGDIATMGAPATGWVQDLKIIQGPKGAELWALTTWLEPAKSYIKAGKYKWASVAVSLDCVDHVTAKKIGAVLTSIAITNTPFIEGMNDLAATKKSGEPAPPAPPPAVTAPMGPFANFEECVKAQTKKGHSEESARKICGEIKKRVEGAAARAALHTQPNGVKLAYMAYSPEEAIDCIRRELGLPVTATTSDIGSDLQKLIELATSGAGDAVGIDAPKIMSNIRTILGLPVMTTIQEVAAQAMKLFALDTEIISGDTGEASGENAVPGSTTPLATVPQGVDHMSLSAQEFEALSKKLGVRATPEAVMKATTSLVAVRLALVAMLGLSPDIADERLEANVADIRTFSEQRKAALSAIDMMSAKPIKLARKVALKGAPPPGADGQTEPDADDADKKAYEGLMSKLGTLFKAAGVEDPEGKIAQIANTMMGASQLEAVMPELAALKQSAQKAEAAAENADVAAALSAHFAGNERHRAMLSSHYKTVGRAKFIEEYPLENGDEPPTVEPLLSAPNGRVAASTQARTQDAPAARDNVVQLGKRGGPTAATGVVDISLYPGANDTERAVNAYLATVQGADKMKRDDLFALACEAKRVGKFVNLSVKSKGGTARG